MADADERAAERAGDTARLAALRVRRRACPWCGGPPSQAVAAGHPDLLCCCWPCNDARSEGLSGDEVQAHYRRGGRCADCPHAEELEQRFAAERVATMRADLTHKTWESMLERCSNPNYKRDARSDPAPGDRLSLGGTVRRVVWRWDAFWVDAFTERALDPLSTTVAFVVVGMDEPRRVVTLAQWRRSMARAEVLP